jgi:hypothetical protein
VFVALAFLPLATGMAGNVVRDRRSEPFLPDQLVELGYAVVPLLWIAVAWRDDGVQLRPDGVWQRGITGRLVVVGYYAAHPGHRAAIGSRAEYDRVMPHLLGPAAAAGGRPGRRLRAGPTRPR